MRQIPFNKPSIAGDELRYIGMAVESGHLSGNGPFTQRCETFFEKRYGLRKSLLTHSCTGALEMAALLLGISPGDEVIMPSFTYVSTANAFVLRGARIRFVDSCADHPNMDAGQVRALIGPKTKAIVCVHYAGMSCDLEQLLAISEETGVPLVEDAAHAIESSGKNGKQLGTYGALGTFSFHETKNISCGEGGMLVVNDESLLERAEIIREKGTNRPAFARGEVSKYEWVDVGSSFLPSELSAAYLYGQLEHLDRISRVRMQLWKLYDEELKRDMHLLRPQVSGGVVHNGHIYYLVLPSEELRNALLQQLRAKGIHAVFHYQALHSSPFYAPLHDGRSLPNAERFSRCLLRLPLYATLEPETVRAIAGEVVSFFTKNGR